MSSRLSSQQQYTSDPFYHFFTFYLLIHSVFKHMPAMVPSVEIRRQFIRVSFLSYSVGPGDLTQMVRLGIFKPLSHLSVPYLALSSSGVLFSRQQVRNLMCRYSLSPQPVISLKKLPVRPESQLKILGWKCWGWGCNCNFSTGEEK